MSGLIQSVTLGLNISGVGDGAYNGDLYATLQHESGFAVLLNRPGRSDTDPLGYGWGRRRGRIAESSASARR